MYIFLLKRNLMFQSELLAFIYEIEHLSHAVIWNELSKSFHPE